MKKPTKIWLAVISVLGATLIAYFNGYFDSKKTILPTSQQTIDSAHQAVNQNGESNISTQLDGDSNNVKSAGRDINEVGGDQNSAGRDVNNKK